MDAMTIDLPAQTAPNAPMTRTVLVVDDDPHIRQLLVFAFEKAGDRKSTRLNSSHG